MNTSWRVVFLTLSLVAVAIICLPEPAMAQGVSVNTFLDWNFLGGGARARGMGGAYLGVSDDGDAGSWNPAGLIYNEGVLVTFQASRTAFNLDLDFGKAGDPKTPLSKDRTLANMPSGAFLAPITIIGQEFVLSAFYNRVQQGYTESSFAAQTPATVDQLVPGPPFSASIGLDGNVALAGGAFGTAITDELSIGGSINIVTGDGKEFYRLEIDSSDFPDPANTKNEKIVWTTKSDLDYNGLFFTAASMYKTDRWSVGVTFSPGWTLTQNLDFRSVETRTNSGIPEEFPKGGIFAPLKGTDREIQIPYTGALGLAYQISENLLVAADYQFRGFHAKSSSEFEDGSSGVSTQEEPANPISPQEFQSVDWYSLHQVRVGAEYRHDSPWGLIPFRAGIRNEPMLIGDNGGAVVTFDQRHDRTKVAEFPYFIPTTEWSQNGSQINAWTFSFGSGIHWSQIALDFALEYSSYSYSEGGYLQMIRRCPTCDFPPIDPDVSFPGDGEDQDRWGKRKTYRWGDYRRLYDSNRLKLMLSFTGHF